MAVAGILLILKAWVIKTGAGDDSVGLMEYMVTTDGRTVLI